MVSVGPSIERPQFHEDFSKRPIAKKSLKLLICSHRIQQKQNIEVPLEREGDGRLSGIRNQSQDREQRECVLNLGVNDRIGGSREESTGRFGSEKNPHATAFCDH